ncbi:hypothetical protein CR513_48628, partial [Mucuna pruriens]
MRCLYGTKDYMLIYKRTNDLEVVSYIDLDYVDCIDTRKSMYGYIFMLAGGVVSWRSVIQSLIVSSTINVSLFLVLTLPRISFMSRLRVVDSISRPLKLYCDNSFAVFMAKNNKSESMPPKNFKDHILQMRHGSLVRYSLYVKFVPCFETTAHGAWLKSFISRLRIVDSISRPLKLYCVNSFAVFVVKNNKSES